MNHDLSLFSCQQCRKHHFRLHASLVCYQVDCSDAKIFSKSFPILFFNLLKRTRFFVSVWHRQKRYSIVRSAFVKVLLHCSFENLYVQTDIGNENPALVSVSGILEESDKCAHVLRACIYGCARIAPGGPTSVEQGNQGLEEAEYVFVKHIRETYSWNILVKHGILFVRNSRRYPLPCLIGNVNRKFNERAGTAQSIENYSWNVWKWVRIPAFSSDLRLR